MLHIPDDPNNVVHLAAFDPGTDTLGASIIAYDLALERIVWSTAITFKASSALPKNTWEAQVHGERFARIKFLGNMVYNFLQHWKPISVSSESPFCNIRHPQAYGALTEIVDEIRNALYNYDSRLPLNMIDPPTAKLAVGAAGNAGKEEVRAAVIAMKGIFNFSGNVSIEELDEHSIDTLAVNYAHLLKLTRG